MTKFLNKVQGNKSKDDNTFHTAIAPGMQKMTFNDAIFYNSNFSVLALAQVFGVLPITGLFSKNIKDIRFKFLSFRTLHSSLWLVSAFIFEILELLRMSREGKINVKSIGK